MEDYSFVILGWLVLAGVPFVAGMLCALLLRQPVSLLLAIGLPWVVFLLFNIYSGQTSPDRELLRGTFLFFQLTLGSVPAISGAVGHWFAAQIARRRVA